MKLCDRRCGPPARRTVGGFTLIELLLVIAIIGILSTLIITTVSNASQDARTVVARQQQITLQDALNAWVAANSSGRLDSTSPPNTLQTARTAYSAASTGLAKLALLSNYLDPSTYNHLIQYSTNNNLIKSDAMNKIGVHLEFTNTWTTNYPIVNQVAN